jgi:hypothetical protein
MSFKVIVAGSRGFVDYQFLKYKLDKLLINKSDVCIISGGAKGADTKEHDMHLLIFKAGWDRYGKSAGYKRNTLMAKQADACVVFWDGKSKGSKHMIDIAKEFEIPVRVVEYKNYLKQKDAYQYCYTPNRALELANEMLGTAKERVE